MVPEGKFELLNTGVYRDGGSIAVHYRRPDGAEQFVTLEVVEIPEPGEDRRFGHLHVGSTAENKCDLATVVSKGSEAEATLMRDLETLANDPHLSPSGPYSDAIEHFHDLQRFLLTRSGGPRA
jgi:hypothetical protein